MIKVKILMKDGIAGYMEKPEECKEFYVSLDKKKGIYPPMLQDLCDVL